MKTFYFSLNYCVVCVNTFLRGDSDRSDRTVSLGLYVGVMSKIDSYDLNIQIALVNLTLYIPCKNFPNNILSRCSFV